MMCTSLTRLMIVQYLAGGRVRACEDTLNTGSDGDEETKGGKLFQTRAAATVNARSPLVVYFDRGMTSAAMFDDRSRRRESTSATRVSSAYGYSSAVPCWQRKYG